MNFYKRELSVILLTMLAPIAARADLQAELEKRQISADEITQNTDGSVTLVKPNVVINGTRTLLAFLDAALLNEDGSTRSEKELEEIRSLNKRQADQFCQLAGLGMAQDSAYMNNRRGPSDRANISFNSDGTPRITISYARTALGVITCAKPQALIQNTLSSLQELNHSSSHFSAAIASETHSQKQLNRIEAMGATSSAPNTEAAN